MQIFDQQGKLIRVLANKGLEDGSVIYPLKVGSDKNDNIYVLDCSQYIEPNLSTENYSLKVFTIDGELLKDEKLWNTFSLRKERDRVEDLKVYPDGDYMLKVWRYGGIVKPSCIIKRI